ncbi:MAG: endonuclease III [Oscillospiraceae bacterium]|nr:endonuclease III [Oscillospiraceae bacterium]
MLKNEEQNNVTEIIKILDKAYPEVGGSLNFKTPFQLAIAVILSAQCTDERVNKTTEIVFKKYPTVQDFNKLSVEELEELFKNINFYRNKSKNIKELCSVLVNDYNGEIPNNPDELVKLPGIGRKSANVILNDAYKNSCGIAVDTHVKRISGRLGLTKETDPSKIEKDLLKMLPKEYWYRANHLFVHYGRHVCKAKNPNCGECIIREYCIFKDH